MRSLSHSKYVYNERVHLLHTHKHRAQLRKTGAQLLFAQRCLWRVVGIILLHPVRSVSSVVVFFVCVAKTAKQ